MKGSKEHTGDKYSKERACKWGGCNGTVLAPGGKCNRCGQVTG